MRAGLPPTADGYGGPYSFDESEGPGSLKKTVGGAHHTGESEKQNEPGTALFERVGDKHAGDGKEAKKCKRTHESLEICIQAARSV